MKSKSGQFNYYFFNCFLLLIPIILWNVFLTRDLPSSYQPEIFWDQIPWFIKAGEQVSRIAVFGLALMMPLRITTGVQRTGVLVYTIGLILYMLSWLLLINFPLSEWSNSWLGFLSPAYTPLGWLMGIGLTGNRFYFNLPQKRWVFFVVMTVFLIFHNVHAWMIYNRLH